ncbi:MAG: hypothetical protein HY052_09870 [Proteobacteria bacterium]|nr:hypothetical protein [Pseudomonadota bacterium]
MDEKRDMGHAARAAEGRAAWTARWNEAWEAADKAAGSEESLADRAAGRRAWAGVMIAARDAGPPPASDAKENEQWASAWAAAWTAAWEAAIPAAKVVLEDRGGNGSTHPPRPGVAADRAARAAAGRNAGCVAWNDMYRAEIKK